MDLDACIRDRRSCREYTNKKVPLAVVGEILDAATHAPSAGNVQNWQFVVVTDERKREQLGQLCMKQDWMVEAPVHVVICNEAERVKQMYPDRGELYATQHCALAAGYMMLKAHELGLGSCMVGGFDVEGVKDLLRIPESIVPEMIVTLGYPDRADKEADRARVETMTFFEEHGKKKADFGFFPVKKQVNKLEKQQKKLAEKGVEKFKTLQRSLKRM